MTWDILYYKEEISDYNLVPKSMYYAYYKNFKICQTHEKEVNHELTPPYMINQFMISDSIVNDGSNGQGSNTEAQGELEIQASKAY